MPSWRIGFLTVTAGMPKPRCSSGRGASSDWRGGATFLPIGHSGVFRRALPGSRLHRSAGQRGRRRPSERSADRRRHARHCPGAPSLWHDRVPANLHHRYTRADANRQSAAARSIGGQDGVLGPASGRPVHQSAASGRPPARSDRATWLRATSRNCANSPALGRSLVTLAPECVPAGFVRTLASVGCAGFDWTQRGARGRCHAGGRRWRNRRDPPIQCHAAIECA